MVAVNRKYFTTGPAVAKILSIILGIFAISLGGHSDANSPYNAMMKLADILNLVEPTSPGLGFETFFLGVVGLFLIYSVLSVLTHFLNEELTYTRQYKLIDIGAHCAGAFLQILAGSLIIASANGITQENCDTQQHFLGGLKDWKTIDHCQLTTEKVFAGIFAIVNCIIYALIARVGYIRLNYNDVVLE